MHHRMPSDPPPRGSPDSPAPSGAPLALRHVGHQGGDGAQPAPQRRGGGHAQQLRRNKPRRIRRSDTGKGVGRGAGWV